MLPQTVNRRVLTPKVPHKHAPPIPHRESMSRAAITRPLANSSAAPSPSPAPSFPSFNFSSQAGSEDEDDEDYEDEEDEDDDDDWLFAVPGEIETEDVRGGFELDPTALVLRIDANACEALEDITAMVQQQTHQEYPALRFVTGNAVISVLAAAKPLSSAEAAKSCVRTLSECQQLAMIFSKLRNKAATDAVAQWLQCVEAVIIEREEAAEGTSSLLLAVLEGWKDHRIIGQSLQNPEQNYAIPCSRIDGCEQDPWVHACTAEQSSDELKVLLKLPMEATVLELNADGWIGFRSAIDALKKATDQAALPAKSSPQKVKKMLRETVAELLRDSSVVLRIVVPEDNGWCSHGVGVKGASAAGIVCQLLQMVAAVVEASEVGHTAHALLEGWTARAICGPDVLDVTAATELPVAHSVDTEAKDAEDSQIDAAAELKTQSAAAQWTLDMRTPHTPKTTFVEDLERDIFHLIAAEEYVKGAKLIEQLPAGRSAGQFGQRVIELLRDKNDCYGILKLLQQLQLNGAPTTLIKQYIPEAEV